MGIEISHKIAKLVFFSNSYSTLPETNSSHPKRWPPKRIIGSLSSPIHFQGFFLAGSGWGRRLIGQFLWNIELYKSQLLWLLVQKSEKIKRKTAEVGSLSHYLQEFYTSKPWLALGFLNHQLLWQHLVRRCIPMALRKPTKKWLRQWGREFFNGSQPRDGSSIPQSLFKTPVFVGLHKRWNTTRLYRDY